jgi:hypothetical protein
MAEFRKSYSRSFVARGPVFALPPTPAGWSGKRSDVIRIVDPTGRAVAWFAPERGAHCVGFSVRTPHRWVSILAEPDRLAVPEAAFGCAVIVSAAQAGCQPCGAQPARNWQLLSRDPTSVTLGTPLDSAEQDRGGGAHVGVALLLEAQLDDATLAINLSAVNRTSTPRDVMIGLLPAFAPGFSSGSPECIEWCAGGHVVEPIRTLDEQLNLKEEGMPGGAEIEVPATCLLRSKHGLNGVVRFDVDVRHVAAARSPETGVLSLAVLGASPGFPVTLQPDGQIRLQISIALQDSGSCSPGSQEN